MRILLLERFDRLDESARSVLEAASVVGPSFSADLVSQVTGLTGTAIECFASLERKDLIVLEPGRDIYRFKHALVQDAIYNRLLSPARQELHEKVANTIEEQGSANQATRALVMVIKGMATWLSWTEAEVSTQETGIWPQATSMWSLYPVQVSL